MCLSSPKSLSQCSIDCPHKISVGVTTFRNRKVFGRRLPKLVVIAYCVVSGTTPGTVKRLGSCLVVPPSSGRRPHAIVKFLGGAFLGAIPEVGYGLLIYLLAKEGFLVIAVPYNVTFDHEQSAKEVYEKFNTCLDMLYATDLAYADLLPSDLLELPVYSVGHSNDALLQLLAGSHFSEAIPKANAVISYNSRPASEAVPYFEQLGPLVTQLAPIIEASPMYAMARATSRDAWMALFDTAAFIIQDYDPEAVISLTKFGEQLPLVMNQVYEGVSEFKPTPFENRNFLKNSHNVQQTLLDIKWKVGNLYTPADALAQGLKSASLYDTKVLARTISDWFCGLTKI